MNEVGFTKLHGMVAGELPKYRCHKEVWALKIQAIALDSDQAQAEGRETDGSATIMPVDARYSHFKVDHDYVRKHKPQVGGILHHLQGWLQILLASGCLRGRVHPNLAMPTASDGLRSQVIEHVANLRERSKSAKLFAWAAITGKLFSPSIALIDTLAHWECPNCDDGVAERHIPGRGDPEEYPCPTCLELRRALKKWLAEATV